MFIVTLSPYHLSPAEHKDKSEEIKKTIEKLSMVQKFAGPVGELGHNCTQNGLSQVEYQYQGTRIFGSAYLSNPVGDW